MCLCGGGGAVCRSAAAVDDSCWVVVVMMDYPSTNSCKRASREQEQHTDPGKVQHICNVQANAISTKAGADDWGRRGRLRSRSCLPLLSQSLCNPRAVGDLQDKAGARSAEE